MAYKKRTYKKKAAKKTSGWQDVKTIGKIAYKHRGTAKKALNMVYRLKDMVNTEYKEVEETLTWKKLGDGTIDGAVDESVTFFPLALPPKGVDENDRIGNSIKLQRLSGRGRISWLNQTTPASGTVSASVRVILMRGKVDAGKLYPVAEEIGTTNHRPFLDQKGTLGAKNDDTKYDTKILYDKTYRLDIARVNNVNLNWNFPLNWHQNFLEGEENELKISNNGLYLAVFTDTGISPKCEFIMNYSVTFTDN